MLEAHHMDTRSRNFGRKKGQPVLAVLLNLIRLLLYALITTYN